MIASQSMATFTISGAALAVVWVIFETCQDTGRKRSLSVTGGKVVCAVVCGITLPGMFREIFQNNHFVQSLEPLWETWFMAGFLFGMSGWSIIFSFRRLWLRALRKAEHNPVTDKYLGAEDVVLNFKPPQLPPRPPQ